MPRSLLRQHLDLVLLTALVAPAVLAACSDTSASNDDSGGSLGRAGKGGKSGAAGKSGAGGKAGAGGTPSVGGQGGAGGPIQVQDPAIKQLLIEPAQGSITIKNGVATPASLAFSAKGQSDQGTTPLSATWTADPTTRATIDGNGKLTATGKSAGAVTVTASYKNLTATATVTVKIEVVDAPADGSVPADAQAKLRAATTPDPSAKLAYPYDQTVFPPGVLPPTIMGTGGGPEDLYMVQLTSPQGSLEVFAKSPDFRVTPADASWLAFLQDAAGQKAQLKVARLSQGTATVVGQQTWPIASGPLRGTVYYWSNNLGRVLRIKPGAKQPDDFLEAAGISKPCSTCHTVSANGSTLILGGDVETSTFDLATNQSTFSTTSVGKPVRNWAMPAVSPSGKFLVENNAALPGPPGGSDGFWNTASGQKITGAGLDNVLLDMPVFSADASRLVYVDHTTKALATMTYSEAGGQPAAGPAQQLVPFSGDPVQQAFAFPAVTPDSKWVVYARSNLDTRGGPGDLYLASAEAPGSETSLDALNGTTYPFVAGERDRHFNYEPAFAPLPAGGYFWVIFTSRRTYGNLLTGPAVGTMEGLGTKQLWMAAIDLHPEPGKDPSHPAFLLQGQDLSTLNMRAFWVFEPCKQDGAGCQFGSDCCEGICEPGSGGALVCSTAQTGQPGPCVPVGNKCTTTADCCDAKKGSECINHFCSDPPPKIE